MHASAYATARQFFEVYLRNKAAGTVVEVGSRVVAEQQRSLRSLCPNQHHYLGLDMEAGINVDIVLTDPYRFPLEAASVDAIVCTSVFEHSAFFWALFEECLRVLRPHGLLYINTPSNGYVRRYPIDAWRFYPDSGIALQDWGRRQGFEVTLLESFITDEDLRESHAEIWNDFVAVFALGGDATTQYPQRMHALRQDYANARIPDNTILHRPYQFPGRSQALAQHTAQATQTPTALRLYQVAYSEETWQSVPEGLLPLDNRSNERPDWAEYWPIRQFLMTQPLDENCWYGFLSPRFFEKMFISPQNLLAFSHTLSADIEVVNISPFIDVRAVFRNVVEQGEWAHPGFMSMAQKVMDEVLPGTDLPDLINTAQTGIYCNYFAAKPRFWRAWLALCEGMFAMAESNAHPCAAGLNQEIAYDKRNMPAKVFLIERMASILLASDSSFTIAKYTKSTITEDFQFLPDAIFRTLDQLKTQALHDHTQLLDAYEHIQRTILTEPSVQIQYLKNLHKSRSLGLHPSPLPRYAYWAGNAASHKTPAKQRVGLLWLLKQLFTRKSSL